MDSVGVIGLGIMGSAMAGNLMKAGFRVVGYDIAARARTALGKRGGVVAASARAVAEAAPVVVTSLPSAAALDAVAAEVAGSGCGDLVVADTSTLAIADKERARKALAEAGTVMLDCPLSGTGAQALSRDLVVYASGRRAAYDRCGAVLDGFARSRHYLGAFGNGTRMKLVANLLVAIHNVAAAEAFVLGMKAGLDPATIYRVIGDGAGSSRMFQVRGPMMVAGDYSAATMKNEVWQKDMAIIAEFARGLGCPTPLFAASAPLYLAAMAEGRGGEDTAAVCAVLQAMAGVRRGAAGRR